MEFRPKNHGFPPKVSDSLELLDKFERFCIDPANTYIGANVAIGEGTIIEPNVYIFDRPDGKSNSIGKNCRVGTNVKLREWFEIGDNVRLGHCCEVVRSMIGDYTQAAHWCHIGDARIGTNCNIAAGVVFSNYDGKYKQVTTIEDYVFIGSLATLIAPVTVKRGAFIAAHATITKEVPEYALVKGVNQISLNKASWPDEIGWEIFARNEHPIFKKTEQHDGGNPPSDMGF